MLTPVKAIRKYCLECSNGQWYEVKMCVIPECPLFEYRFGSNPNRKGSGGFGKKISPYNVGDLTKKGHPG